MTDHLTMGYTGSVQLQCQRKCKNFDSDSNAGSSNLWIARNTDLGNAMNCCLTQCEDFALTGLEGHNKNKNNVQICVAPELFFFFFFATVMLMGT